MNINNCPLSVNKYAPFTKYVFIHKIKKIIKGDQSVFGLSIETEYMQSIVFNMKLIPFRGKASETMYIMVFKINQTV